MNAIVVDHLCKTYRNGVDAVTDVSFTVSAGEIFGLLGPNGAGKSTTVRMLATLSVPSGGSAQVAGRDVESDAAGVRRRIGYVAQASGVDRHGTGRENLTLQAHLERVPKRDIAGRVGSLLEWIGLTEAADRLVNTYSGGMKRRLDIAMGLVHEPEVLYLDEPTTGLDPETRSALWADLKRIRQERKLTVLLTTHYLEEADQLCDRVAIIDRGRVVIEGVPSDLKAKIEGDSVTLNVEGRTSEGASVLRTMEEVLEVIEDGDSIVARVAHGATAVPALITALERAGIGVNAVTLSRPSLDDVYLHYTGHRFTSNGMAEQNHQAPANRRGGDQR
ncbi:MAG: ATP-binding cassette domain-containing protein [Bacteroidetes bacterium]|nr:ATP-binding cassette domain-containing protein [Bacteroidota bacterium]